MCLPVLSCLLMCFECMLVCVHVCVAHVFVPASLCAFLSMNPFVSSLVCLSGHLCVYLQACETVCPCVSQVSVSVVVPWASVLSLNQLQ